MKTRYGKTLIFILIGTSVMATSAFSGPNIKQPNVSGQFYEADPRRLSATIDGFFADAVLNPSSNHIDILVVPHAGYVYSGAVAAYGFKAVSARKYKTVVILAPSHYVAFDGVSIWAEGAFQTPLGAVEVDDAFTKRLLAANGKFYSDPKAFTPEHSLEVELPFLQKTFKDFKIVPVVMGQPDFTLLEEFAGALKDIIGDRQDVLIVVSTDLSHYHDDAAARQLDRRAIEAIQRLEARQVWEGCRAQTIEMCGCVPVTAALLYARKKGLTKTDVLQYANSGDVTGDVNRVVGYASVVIYGDGDRQTNSEDAGGLTPRQKKRLIQIARETMDRYVRTGVKLNVEEPDARLTQKEGAFVTLHKNGSLRGCIGNIIGRKPLYLTVRDLAIASATEDHRFTPVKPEELDQIEVEVSVLSQPKTVTGIDEITLGVHGVIVSQGPLRSGVFLPQVAGETGWTKEEFLSELCVQKAGLPAGAWKDPETKIEIFTAEVFSEKDVR
jgi:AmmeMemoRadiSam system protein B/AmmeMemoRadiSam system protein A